MIAKEFLKELSILVAKYGVDNIELVVGFDEQWKKVFEIFTNQDKNCYEILADELDDIIIPTSHFIDIIKFYNKNNFSYEKEIKVRYKDKYYTITDLYIDIDNCVVVKNNRIGAKTMNRKTKIISEICRAEDLAELKNICSEYEELNGKLDNYLTDDEALEYIKNTCDSMQRLYYTITDIIDYNSQYFYLDNYGNLSNIDESLDDIKHDLINEL